MIESIITITICKERIKDIKDLIKDDFKRKHIRNLSKGHRDIKDIMVDFRIEVI